jgi:hypothetical protein
MLRDEAGMEILGEGEEEAELVGGEGPEGGPCCNDEALKELLNGCPEGE